MTETKVGIYITSSYFEEFLENNHFSLQNAERPDDPGYAIIYGTQFGCLTDSIDALVFEQVLGSCSPIVSKIHRFIQTHPSKNDFPAFYNELKELMDQLVESWKHPDALADDILSCFCILLSDHQGPVLDDGAKQLLALEISDYLSSVVTTQLIPYLDAVEQWIKRTETENILLALMIAELRFFASDTEAFIQTFLESSIQENIERNYDI